MPAPPGAPGGGEPSAAPGSGDACAPAAPDGARQHSPDDWQSQMDEVAALASIYGADFGLLACPGLPQDALDDEVDPDVMLGLRCPARPSARVACEVLCAVDVPPGGLQLALDIAAPEGAASDSEEGGVLVGEPVQYLPPISLRLQLPHTYPSASAPEFELCAGWLAPQQAARLAGRLAELWEEQGPGGPIVFVWADWLKSEALSQLGILERLVLGHGHGRAPAAPADGASSSCAAGPPPGAADAMQTAVQLLRCQAAREAEAFRASSWRCQICFDDVPGSSCMRLPECGHYYCSACLTTHVRTQLDCGAVENMRCPEPSCRLVMPPYMLQELLGPEGFEKWEERLLQRTLDKMEDVVYCPRCDAVVVEGSQNCAECPECLFIFCSLCHDVWHPPSERCLDEEQRLLVLERRRQRCARKDEAREADLAQQLHSLRLVQQTSKRCPSCHMGITKTEGCNKMVCSYCTQAWCWRCERAVTGYEHFREGKCTLFEQSEIDRWNRQMWQAERAQEVERGQIIMQVLGGAPNAQICRCPVCGQESVKQGRNNLIRCWACNQHFCAACRTWLRGRVGAHYGIGKPCKQHD